MAGITTWDPSIGDVVAPNAGSAVDVGETTYTFQRLDAGRYVRFSSGSPVTATVPVAATGKWTLSDRIEISQQGAGTVTIAADAGVTINPSATLSIANQYGVAMLIYEGADVWTLCGNISA